MNIKDEHIISISYTSNELAVILKEHALKELQRLGKIKLAANGIEMLDGGKVVQAKMSTDTSYELVLEKKSKNENRSG